MRVACPPLVRFVIMESNDADSEAGYTKDAYARPVNIHRRLGINFPWLVMVLAWMFALAAASVALIARILWAT